VSTHRIVLRDGTTYDVEASYVDEVMSDKFVLLMHEDDEGDESIRAYVNRDDLALIIRSHE
jgi:hypothetical protein